MWSDFHQLFQNVVLTLCPQLYIFFSTENAHFPLFQQQQPFFKLNITGCAATSNIFPATITEVSSTRHVFLFLVNVFLFYFYFIFPSKITCISQLRNLVLEKPHFYVFLLTTSTKFLPMSYIYIYELSNSVIIILMNFSWHHQTSQLSYHNINIHISSHSPMIIP